MSRNARIEASEFAANASPSPWRFGEVVHFSYGHVEAGKGVMAKKLPAKGGRNLAKSDGARTYDKNRHKVNYHNILRQTTRHHSAQTLRLDMEQETIGICSVQSEPGEPREVHVRREKVTCTSSCRRR